MASMVNGASGSSPSDIVSPVPASMPASAKQLPKPTMNAGNKNGDVNRKQANSPSNGTQRPPAPPNAWKAGMNPITQRSNNASQQNGAGQQNKTRQKPSGQNADPTEKTGNDRLVFLLGSSMGCTASITTKTGDVFSGIFFGAKLENEPTYLLKMVQQLKHGEKNEGVNGIRESSKDFVGVGEDYSMSFEFRDVVDFAVEGAPVSTQEKQLNGSAGGFLTDTDISGNLTVRERELKRWTPSEDTNVDMSLESSNGGTWDQFAANEEKFGLKSDYNEDFYTTSIDRKSASYRQHEARAARLAREIEGAGSKNNRARDEEEGDEDEEEKYSGVRRQATDYPPLQSTNPNRYMPPARRPPSGQATVAGAPVDPAIISSALARPSGNLPKPPDTSAASTESNTKASVVSQAVPSPDAKQESSKESVPAKTASDAPKAPVTNATANVEVEVLDSFRTFASQQKTKVADDRQKRARQDKDIKLNDLKGFSKNFKLHTPVPKDLVPILAKDKKKQDEIMEKAQREAERQAASPPKLPKTGEDRTLADAKQQQQRDTGSKGGPSGDVANSYRQQQQQYPPRGPNNRQHPAQYGNQASPQGGPSSGYLASRLAETQRAHKAGNPMPVPTPLPIHYQKSPGRITVDPSAGPSSQASSTVRTPTSAAFNVNAIEFRPNPAANTFQPTGPPAAAAAAAASTTTASPRTNANARAAAASRPSSPSAFFGGKKVIPPSERPSIMEHSNPLKRLKEKAEADDKAKDLASNGGIAHAYSTPVRWFEDDEAGKSYKDMFGDPPAVSTGVSPRPSTASPMHSNQAHLHQLPTHLQQPGMHPGPSPHHVPYSGPPQPHLYPGAIPGGAPHQYEDHRMHGSPSASNYSTPRMQNGYVPYASPMGPGAPFPYGQPMPPHVMGAAGPQPPNFRPYANGPQYMPSPAQPMAAPMMVQQGSQGGYMAPQGMGVPHMPMYGASPNPPFSGPPQPSSGYPSPSRAAPMMMHQGSYQGQTPQMHPGGGQYGPPQPYYAQSQPPHMNPMRGGYPSSPQQHYSQSPQAQYQYPPQQPQRMSSQGYGHHPHGGPQHPPLQQGPPPPGAAPMEGGEAMK